MYELLRRGVVDMSATSATCKGMDPDIFSPHEVARYLGVSLHYGTLDHAYGYTDGTRNIWLDNRLTAARERSVLTHELFHVIHGHVGRQPHHVEEQVRRSTARLLIPWRAFLAAYGEQVPPHDIADALRVTVDVLHDRIQHATPDELLTMRGASCDWQAA